MRKCYTWQYVGVVLYFRAVQLLAQCCLLGGMLILVRVTKIAHFSRCFGCESFVFNIQSYQIRAIMSCLRIFTFFLHRSQVNRARPYLVFRTNWYSSTKISHVKSNVRNLLISSTENRTSKGFYVCVCFAWIYDSKHAHVVTMKHWNIHT